MSVNGFRTSRDRGPARFMAPYMPVRLRTITCSDQIRAQRVISRATASEAPLVVVT